MIVVAPLHEVDDAIRRWRPSHAVSLSSPGAQTGRLPDDMSCLRLIFHDIVEPEDGLSIVTEDQVAQLLRFSAGWSGGAPLLVQCWAGVSRSPAAAYAIACQKHPGSERALASALRSTAPFVTPNRRVVALADRVLARGGTMTLSVSSIGRGADTTMGHTFVPAF